LVDVQKNCSFVQYKDFAMPYVPELCINMPPDFPAREFSAFLDNARKALIEPEGTTPQWKEFGLASNIIAWRYRSAHEALQFLRGRYSTTTGSIDHEDLYERERALFTLFTAGVSCIEACIYAIAAYYSKVTGFQFEKQEQRACGPNRLRKWIEPFPGMEAIADAIKNIDDSVEWKLWVEVRNRLSHRGNLPGIIYVGAPLPTVNPILFDETTSTDPIDMGVQDLNAHFDWITNTLLCLMRETVAL
jgi:hypothetical protein